MTTPLWTRGSLHVDLIDLQTHLVPEPQTQCVESSGQSSCLLVPAPLSLATCSDGFLNLSVPQLSAEWDLNPHLTRL